MRMGSATCAGLAGFSETRLQILAAQAAETGVPAAELLVIKEHAPRLLVTWDRVCTTGNLYCGGRGGARHCLYLLPGRDEFDGNGGFGY